MLSTKPTYNQLNSIYKEWFTTGYLPSIEEKFALISLVGWLVYELRKKKPDITYYQIVNKLAEGSGLDEYEIYKIAIICDDFAYGCTKFPNFGLELNQVPAKIKELFSKIMPF